MTEKFDPQEIARASIARASSYASEAGLASVYVGGAPLAGLGSPKSDTDVFVVVDSVPGDTEQVIQDGHRLDVEYVTWTKLDELAELVMDYRVTPLDMTQLTRASRSTLDFLTRFHYGQVLADQDGRLVSLQKRISSPESRLKDLLIARHAIDIGNLVEDVDGAIQSGDLACADYQAREAVYRAAEALLASKDDLYVNTKWLWAKWNRTIGDSISPALGATLKRPTFDEHPEPAHALTWLAQDLLIMALTEQNYVPALETRTESGAVRDPYVVPIATIQGMLAMRQVDEGVQLSREGLLLWGIAHSRTKDDAVRAATGIIRSWGQLPTSEEVADYYDQLINIGLLIQS